MKRKMLKRTEELNDLIDQKMNYNATEDMDMDEDMDMIVDIILDVDMD